MRDLTNYRMDGISGYVSIMDDPWVYVNYTKLGKLRHDLVCLEMAGYSGYGYDSLENRGGILAPRQWFIDDVKKQIQAEERKLKLRKLNDSKS